MISIKDKLRIKLVQKWIVNAIKKMGGGLPQEFNNIDKLPYTFSKPEFKEKGVYQVEINLVDVNGFLYPAEIFVDEPSKSSPKFRYLKLKKKYECYGVGGELVMDKSRYGVLSFISNEGDLDFKWIAKKRSFLINTENPMMFLSVEEAREEKEQEEKIKEEDYLF